jgi:SAM-dependent methyltransferase
VEPRFGRLYAAAVLRPLAEQLVAELGVRTGETACDLICDSGTLGVVMGAAAGLGGRVVLVDTDATLLRTAATEVAGAGYAVSTALAGTVSIPVADATCDRVGSLCTSAFWGGATLFHEAQRVVRPAGTAAVLAWPAGDPPAHEWVLARALRDAAALHSRFLDVCQSAARPGRRAPWDATPLHDVVRFDGIAHYWAAMVVERPVAAELASVPEATVRAVRAACEQGLRPFTAADGTMRIPVLATMWRHTAGES